MTIRKETGLARIFIVFIIVRLFMRMIKILLRMVIMMVGMVIIMDRINYKFGHLKS